VMLSDGIIKPDRAGNCLYLLQVADAAIWAGRDPKILPHAPVFMHVLGRFVAALVGRAKYQRAKGRAEGCASSHVRNPR
jgi:hypothetical protein